MSGLGAICKTAPASGNVKVARQWFEKAAALGNPEAKQNLREMRR
jgi:TPR repeat protein